MSKENELVAGIPRSDLFGFAAENNFESFSADEQIKKRFLSRFNNHMAFCYRDHCETNRDFKPLIPYCLICQGDEFFVTRRLEAGGESRLHEKRSILMPF